MGKILIGSDALSKVYVGSSEVSKMILNGATVYESTPAGYTVAITNNTDRPWNPDNIETYVTVYGTHDPITTYTESGNVRTYTLSAGTYQIVLNDQQFFSSQCVATGGVSFVESPYYLYADITVAGDGTVVLYGEDD